MFRESRGVNSKSENKPLLKQLKGKWKSSSIHQCNNLVGSLPINGKHIDRLVIQ
jgi:hypothetical protein